MACTGDITHAVGEHDGVKKNYNPIPHPQIEQIRLIPFDQISLIVSLNPSFWNSFQILILCLETFVTDWFFIGGLPLLPTVMAVSFFV